MNISFRGGSNGAYTITAGNSMQNSLQITVLYNNSNCGYLCNLWRKAVNSFFWKPVQQLYNNIKIIATQFWKLCRSRNPLGHACTRSYQRCWHGFYFEVINIRELLFIKANDLALSIFPFSTAYTPASSLSAPSKILYPARLSAFLQANHASALV